MNIEHVNTSIFLTRVMWAIFAVLANCGAAFADQGKTKKSDHPSEVRGGMGSTVNAWKLRINAKNSPVIWA